MRLISAKERNNGMKYCTFCKPSKVDAIHRSQFRGLDLPIQFACDNHKHLIQDGERPKDRQENSFNHDKSEADYQLEYLYGI